MSCGDAVNDSAERVVLSVRDLAGATPPRARGRVSLVGAGPGDPELLTVKALARIREADAIVHDALVSDAIRALFPARAHVIDAGKRGGSVESSSQAAIQELLVDLAQAGLHVVRLKGGDPLIFGRGGEEARWLERHGIAWEIVPGISAANGAAASALLPLTHRALSRSCTMIEAHDAGLHRVPWRALVDLGGTWVFFMGKGATQEIAQSLIIHGADADLPLAVVENATLLNQTVFVATLTAVAQAGYAARTAGPGLVIVGPTLELFHELDTLVSEANAHDRPLSDLPGLTA
jgi:uroporphyrin-III C-methyltransferase